MMTTFQNPILKGNYADPSIIRVGSDYYMVNTSYKYLPGLIVWHSCDLINWEPISSALKQYVGDVWAPDFVYFKEKYYIYFPANRTNWVVVADDPRGPWSEPVDLQMTLIDPGHVVGPDGLRYLHLSDGKMAQLADDGLSVVGEVRHVFDPWEYPDDWEVEAFSLEGPKLTLHNGYYYLTIAEGGTSGPPTSHMAACSRSRTPWGPWEHSPHNPIIRTKSKEERWWSIGHGSLIDTPEGNWWMIFHGYDNSFHTTGRHTLLLPIEWTEDGWYKVPDGVSAEQALLKPPGKVLQHGFPTTDYFAGNTIGDHWQLFGEMPEQRFHQEDGALHVAGSEDGRIAPLLYMVGDRAYEADIEVLVEGEAEARLMLYYSDTAYFGVGVNQGGVRFYRTFKNYRSEPYEGTSLQLRVRNDHNIVTFYYKEQHGEWKKYDKVTDASGFHHNTFGLFLSLRIGLDAVGKGSVTYKSFQYRTL